MTQVYTLLDGGALSGDERSALRREAQAQPLYAFIKDPQAEDFGPWLLPRGVAEDLNLPGRLKQDEHNNWALSTLQTDATLENLAHHLASLSHIWTADGQRFFLRFADGRSLRAVWAVLDASQKTRVVGPLQAWITTARDGGEAPLFEPVDVQRPAGKHVPHRLTLTDPQLDALLALCWPDQLLSAVLEESPALAHGRTAAELYSLSAKTCEWLKQTKEDRFPHQKASLAHVLDQRAEVWAPPAVEA